MYGVESMSFQLALDPTAAMKRARSPSDVDGAGTSMFQSKKQRLHLQLFTSRLSKPYAAPSSYIVGQGQSKIAVWAKKNGLDAENRRGDLRRVASMNRMKKRITNEGRPTGTRNFLSGTSPDFQQCEHTISQPRRQIRIPPSPLGISNYAALDDEEPFFEEETFGSESENRNEIYSDFNVLDPVERDSHLAAEEDQLHSVFARAPLEMSPLQLRREEIMADEVVAREERPPSPPDLLHDVLKEKERQGEMSFMEL